MKELFAVGAGCDAPLGTTLTEEGANFAVFSAHATAIEVCLFSEEGHEIARRRLPEQVGHIWFGHISGIRAGQIYGLRAHGPYAPSEGHRFNPQKLLIDPYARRLSGPLEWSEPLSGGTDTAPDERDSAAFAPKCVLVPPPQPYTGKRPSTPWPDTVIYEAHAVGLTRQWPSLDAPGTLAALTAPPVLEHLRAIGVTAIELLPVHAYMTDRFLVERDLGNYWGYQSLGFFAPHPEYIGADRIETFQSMVRNFHEAGIEVLLDVVFNHTVEGDEKGPTVAFRGLDNESYYSLASNRARYENHSGTGNTLRTSHPAVQRLILDSLRYWVEIMGVDGFRFDLAATLGREEGFDPGAGLFDAMRQDPVLSRVKLIAEPWDIGPGGYQLGHFPSPFAEWNDQFRDTLRRFWRGDKAQVPDLAQALVGSASRFDHSGRAATSSVNLITAHDGFTLADLTMYSERHNAANSEDGRDGHGANYSDNLGTEGPSENPDIEAARILRRKNVLATLFLSQGTPMLLAGDEAGNSQHGNNNAYAQGNSIGWVDWQSGVDLSDFVASLTALRRKYPILSQSRFLHSEIRPDGQRDLVWRRADGGEMHAEDWIDPELHILAVELRAAADAAPWDMNDESLLLVFNAGGDQAFSLPPGNWERIFSTAPAQPSDHIPASSVAVFAARP